MNIAPTSIKAYAITLPEPELRMLVAELGPQSMFSGPFKAALNGAVEVSDTPIVNRKPRAGKSITLKHSPKGTKSPRGETGASTKVPCEACGKLIARKFLSLHLRTKHGQSDLATAGAAEKSG